MDEKNDWLVDLMSMTTDEQLTPGQVKIVRAATEIFAEKGFSAASTSEIAQRAGVAEGTIFRHYKTKKDLLFSIVLPIISKIAVPFLAEKLVQEVFQGRELHSMEDMLRELVKNRFDFVKKNVPLFKIILQEIPYHPEIQASFKKVFMEKVYPNFVARMEQFRRQEQLADFPVETVLRLTLSTILGLIVTRFIVLPDHPWDDEQEIEYTIQFLRNGLRAV